MMGTQDSVLAGEEGIAQCHQVVTVQLGRGRNTELRGQVGGWALLCPSLTVAKVLITFVYLWKGGNASGSPPMLGSVEGEMPGPTDLIPGALLGSASP